MEFEYEKDRGECGAIIDAYGWLCIKNRFNCIALKGEGIVTRGSFDVENARKKFYKGDKVTITF